jgi:hypothetical protein
VTVRDSATGAFIAAGAAVTAKRRGEVGFPDSVALPNEPRFNAESISLGIAPGTYDVVVQKPGYAAWMRTVNVNDGGCSPETVAVESRLQRQN